MLAALAMVILGASEVSLEVAPGVACVERARVVERLVKEGVKVVEVTKELTVDVRLSGATIQVRGRVRGEVLERQVPANARDCPGVERVLVALIASWAKRLPKGTPSPPTGADAGLSPSPPTGADAGLSPSPPTGEREKEVRMQDESSRVWMQALQASPSPRPSPRFRRERE